MSEGPATVKSAAAAPSIRARLAIITIIGVVAALTAANTVLSQLFERHVTRQFESSLTTSLNQLAASIDVNEAQGRIVVREPAGDPRWSKPYSGLYWQVDQVSAQGAKTASGIARSRSLWDAILQLPQDPIMDGAIHSHAIIGPQEKPLIVLERTIRLPDGASAPAARLIIAEDASTLGEAVAEFRATSARYLIALAIFLFMLLALQLTIGLSPLKLLTRALAALKRGETAAIEGRFPAEVDPLVRDFNAVLKNNQQVVDRARTHAGNLAHAIKTPLTVLSNAAADERSDVKGLQQLVREQVALARQQVDWHLQRARASAIAGARPGQYTDIAPVGLAIIKVIAKAFAEKNIHFDCNIDPPGLRFAGEEQDLQEMLGNLIENAAKWCRHRVVISTPLDAQGRRIIVIEDDGPGLDMSDRERVLERGVRADQRKPGSGLGLSIVSELTELYQGEFLLGQSEKLGGLKASLLLGLADPVTPPR